MKKTTLIGRLLAASLGIGAVGAVQAAVPGFDLGVASGYSGFFYGNVSKVTDVEGRLAVGGDLATSGFSFGYRTQVSTSLPSLVVGGNVALGGGTIYASPGAGIDTNASIGPVTEYTKNWNGFGIYGGSNSSVSYLTLNKSSNVSRVVDFNAARSGLTALSSTLGSTAGNGSVTVDGSGTYLKGDLTSDLQVFNLSGGAVKNLVLSDIKAGSTVVINVTGSEVSFTGGQDGQLAALRAHVIYNLIDANVVNINTFVYGTVLANYAELRGAGHLEGNIIANAMNGTVEIGYEPFKGYIPSAVPEPASYAMLLGGLGLMGLVTRRRQQQ
ncbi:choice-of-anchor A family protein [Duganella sp.]|uniref:choice-of-anchor A family protein n=1 Tax=Duganella sp. TaxID=1904440 RepID=UPI0031D0E3DD